MKSIYICGDSFGTIDPEYGDYCWVDVLTRQLKDRATITNLSMVNASNLMISLQVDRAIQNQADFVICLCTSSVRSTALIAKDNSELLDRFFNKTLVPYSIPTVAERAPTLKKEHIALIKTYHAEFFDLDLSIYESQCIIENTLRKLVNSGIDFKFDQGGFEHPRFGGATEKYFVEFQQHRSQYNLWDYALVNQYRPYFHITDSAVHQIIADYYTGLIND
jgi:hypothetical protein